MATPSNPPLAPKRAGLALSISGPASSSSSVGSCWLRVGKWRGENTFPPLLLLFGVSRHDFELCHGKGALTAPGERLTGISGVRSIAPGPRVPSALLLEHSMDGERNMVYFESSQNRGFFLSGNGKGASPSIPVACFGRQRGKRAKHLTRFLLHPRRRRRRHRRRGCRQGRDRVEREGGRAEPSISSTILLAWSFGRRKAC